jgi:peptidyl-prolyl cis-trans isomerase C
MLKRSILAAVIAAPLMVPALAMAQDQTADTVVATVNGQDITLGEMIVMKQTMQQDPQTANMPDQALWDMMLDQLIRQAAVAETGTESAGVRAQIGVARCPAIARGLDDGRGGWHQ